MAWQAQLSLDYALEQGRTVARFAHDGPLRILQSLWPEGDTVCHNVLVHPPGGLVGGDTLSGRVQNLQQEAMLGVIGGPTFEARIETNESSGTVRNILTREAMKMEMVVRAPRAAAVQEIVPALKTSVQPGDLLALLA